MINALSDTVVSGTALNWFCSFLSGQTQQVIVNNCLLDSYVVASAVMQGLVCDPLLLAVVLDFLLQRLKLLV